jgi:hypothetical protein
MKSVTISKAFGYEVNALFGSNRIPVIEFRKDNASYLYKVRTSDPSVYKGKASPDDKKIKEWMIKNVDNIISAFINPGINKPIKQFYTGD